MYQIDGAIKARAQGHTLDFIGTAKFRTYTVDKFLCACGRAEIQIASTQKIGVWVSDGALKPCANLTTK